MLIFCEEKIIGRASAASQVIKIEICDIYMYSTYVRIYPPGVVAIGGWLQSGRSRVRSLLWNSGGFFLSPFLYFSLSFSPFPLFLPSLPFISPPSFFPFMLAPPLQCSSIFLVIWSAGCVCMVRVYGKG